MIHPPELRSKSNSALQPLFVCSGRRAHSFASITYLDNWPGKVRSPLFRRRPLFFLRVIFDRGPLGRGFRFCNGCLGLVLVLFQWSGVRNGLFCLGGNVHGTSIYRKDFGQGLQRLTNESPNSEMGNGFRQESGNKTITRSLNR